MKTKAKWTKSNFVNFRALVAAFCDRHDHAKVQDGWIVFPTTALGMRLCLQLDDARFPTIFVQFADGELAKIVFGRHPRLNQFHGGKFNFHFEPETTPEEAFAEFERDIAPAFSEGAWGTGEASILREERKGLSWFAWKPAGTRSEALQGIKEKG